MTTRESISKINVNLTLTKFDLILLMKFIGYHSCRSSDESDLKELYEKISDILLEEDKLA